LPELKRTDLSVRQERALLVALLLPGSSIDYPDPLAELAALAGAAGAEVAGRLIQRRDRIDPACYIGRGKAETAAGMVVDCDADVIIFDNDLSPAQIRELENITDRKVIDRSELILDIFATRARTHQARLQVELAQLEYTAPRLRGMWTHLERIAGAGGGTQAGAVGGIGTRGPGERQIEIDRRLVQKRVAALRRELHKIDRRRLREVRSRSDSFTVSIVGYTNAGKSSLLNALTDADVHVADKLFATLDTRTRRWDLGDSQTALLSDTVGFVRNLPHHLVASFRATLEETINADLLLHVADVSHPAVDRHISAVEAVLSELGCVEKPAVLLLNKIDRLDDPTILQAMQAARPDAITISARTGQGLDKLVEEVLRHVRANCVTAELLVDCNDGAALAAIYRTAKVSEQRVEGERLYIRVSLSPVALERLAETDSGIEILSREPVG
jgi:GTP-binding protein HflX